MPPAAAAKPCRKILKAMGMSYDDIKLLFVAAGSGYRYQGGNIVRCSGTLPIREQWCGWASVRDIELIPLGKVYGRTNSQIPYYRKTRSRGTYKGERRYASAGSRNVIVAHEDMDEELAYTITKVLFDNVKSMGDTRPLCRWIGDSLKTPIEIHPGAANTSRSGHVDKDALKQRCIRWTVMIEGETE